MYVIEKLMVQLVSNNSLYLLLVHFQSMLIHVLLQYEFLQVDSIQNLFMLEDLLYISTKRE